MRPLTAIASFVTLAGAALALNALASPPKPAVSVGAPAPSFSTMDSTGKAVKLEDYRGKYVVLEWSNFGCPYVKKHYGSGHMQSLQKKYTAKGVAWLTVFSSAPGTQGYFQPAELTKLAKEKGMASTVVPDPEGALGRLYGAKNTPTLFIIDPTGKTVYMGGIDDKATPDPEDLATAHNYVAAALDEALAGKTITTSVTRPYGCGIHYAN
jgi:peroxiredoxin